MIASVSPLSGQEDAIIMERIRAAYGRIPGAMKG